MSYNKNSRRTGARASAVPLPPPPAEWPYLESSATRARTRNASATATGGNNRAQQRLGDVNEGGSLPQQDAILEPETQDGNNPGAQRGSSLPQQVGLEPQTQAGTAISRGSGSTLAQELLPEQQQPGESFQEFVDRHRRLALSVPVTWGGYPSLAPPTGDEPPPSNSGAGATRPPRDADSAPFPAEWWRGLPEGLSPEQATAVWLKKGRPNCTACGRAHPPPHSDLVARQNRQRRRQQKLEYRAKQQAAAAAAAPEVKKEQPEQAASPSTTRAAGKRQNNRCQRCGNFHSGRCRTPWCHECDSAHPKKKGEPCMKRVEILAGALSVIQDPAVARSLMQANSDRPDCSEEMRTFVADILASGDPAQAAAMMQAYVERRGERSAGGQHQQQQQQQQQQDRSSPRRNQRGRPNQRPRGRSASPRGGEPGGGSGYRERSPNTRRNGNRGGGRGPSRRPPKNG